MQVRALVRRCHNYCNFEVELIKDCENISEADFLRKNAAVLVDQAVADFKEQEKAEKSNKNYDYNSKLEITQLVKEKNSVG